MQMEEIMCSGSLSLLQVCINDSQMAETSEVLSLLHAICVDVKLALSD